MVFSALLVAVLSRSQCYNASIHRQGEVGMAVEERVSRLEGEQSGMSSRVDDMRSDMNSRFNDLRSDMNFRFNLLIGLQVVILGVLVTVLLRL